MADFEETFVKTMNREWEESLRVDEAARNTLKDSSCSTLTRLSYWQWDLDAGGGDLIFKERGLTLGRAVASVFVNTITRVDDYFDTQRGKYYGIDADGLRNSMGEMDVDPELEIDGRKGAEVRVKEVIDLVVDYIDVIPEGKRKTVATGILGEFNNRTFSALVHKSDTLEPFYRLIYTLGAEKTFSETEMERIGRVLTVAQIKDDIGDFNEDRRQGNINIVVGYFNERLSEGMDGDRAKREALKSAKKLLVGMGIAKGYYLFGLQAIVSIYLSRLKNKYL